MNLYYITVLYMKVHRSCNCIIQYCHTIGSYNEKMQTGEQCCGSGMFIPVFNKGPCRKSKHYIYEAYLILQLRDCHFQFFLYFPRGGHPDPPGFGSGSKSWRVGSSRTAGVCIFHCLIPLYDKIG